MESILNSTKTKGMKGDKLQNKVILIINGLSERGRTLANMLSRQGADVAIVDYQPQNELTQDIKRDVLKNGGRCLVLIPDTLAIGKRPFAQVAIQMIIQTFGRLDAFISYAGQRSEESEKIPVPQAGAQSASIIFDKEGLAKAALNHILAQKQD